MKGARKLHFTLYGFGFAGAGIFTVLLVRQGIGEVMSALATAGWAMLAVIGFHLFPVLLDGIAWWILFPPNERLPLPQLVWMRWIGESVSTLLPGSSVSGTIARARLAALYGARLRIAAGTVLVDLTLGVFVQIVFTLLGLWLLVQLSGAHTLILPVLAGVITGGLGVAGFYFVQRFGLFRLLGMLIERFAASSAWRALISNAAEFDAELRGLYRRRGSVLVCCLATLASLVVLSGEIYIALVALGAEATPLKALALQSSIYTIRSALFMVPGAIGVQEGGYVAIGHLLGVPGDVAFALSLVARVRELALGVPGLLVWQWIEARRLFGARKSVSG